MRAKFTHEMAAKELDDSYSKGYSKGRESRVGAVCPGQDFSFTPSCGWLWHGHLHREFRRGYIDGQADRRSELEWITEEQVERRVAAAIAELPDCKPIEEMVKEAIMTPFGYVVDHG